MSLSVGQTLKDGSVTITATDAPMAMTMTVDIINRKVVAKETITTPA
jgi:acetamidase/formamidase